MPTPPATHELDVRGVPCPLSWAQAKCLLDGLKPGDIVRVLTDDPRAVRDLPRAAEAEGYAIVEIVPCPQLTRIVIER